MCPRLFSNENGRSINQTNDYSLKKKQSEFHLLPYIYFLLVLKYSTQNVTERKSTILDMSIGAIKD